MDDFWASGADGVTVRRVTLFVVVFKMAGGLPSRARVATGEELRKVFIVAVLLAFRRGFPLCMREGAAGSRSLGRRGGGAPAGLPSGRVPPILALAEFGAGGCYKGHLEPEPSWGGLQKASWSCSARVEAKPLERGRSPPKSSPVAQATNRALVASLARFFWAGRLLWPGLCT